MSYLDPLVHVLEGYLSDMTISFLKSNGLNTEKFARHLAEWVINQAFVIKENLEKEKESYPDCDCSMDTAFGQSFLDNVIRGLSTVSIHKFALPYDFYEIECDTVWRLRKSFPDVMEAFDEVLANLPPQSD